MIAERVRKLYEQVEWIAANFKDYKTMTELDFEKIVSVQPMSDTGACATFLKKHDQKQAVCFFLWLEREKRFIWWFPSDSDLLFMTRAQVYRELSEQHNAIIVTGKIF